MKQHVRTFSCIMLLALATLVTFGIHQKPEQKRINGFVLRDAEPPSERTSFSVKGPQGNWSATIVPDLDQTRLNFPVVVHATHLLMGNKEWNSLKLTRVTLRNYSSKTVLAVSLAWKITTNQDRHTALRQGFPGLFEAYLLPGETKKVESPVIDFAKLVTNSRFEEPLAKNGILNGDFLVKVRVDSVQFEDGSEWRESFVVQPVKALHHVHHPNLVVVLSPSSPFLMFAVILANVTALLS